MSSSPMFRMSSSTDLLAGFTQFFLDNPGVHAIQGVLLVIAVIVLFLLFWTLRDILMRTRSFWYQFICIVLVAVLPMLGFLIYLLIRPARTIREREVEAMLLTLVATEAPAQVTVGESVDEPLTPHDL